MKPLIGITCNFDPTDSAGMLTHFGVAGQGFHMLAEHYIKAVEKAGGIPIMIPIYQDFDNAKTLVDRMDGILISGGNDVDPQRYGELISKECGGIVPERDEQDIAIVKYVIEATSKPILGICRGIQVFNIAMGGTIYQDLGKAGFHDHFISAMPLNHASHEVVVEEKCLLYDIFGAKKVAVNSFHHQAVKNLGNHLVTIARSATDGVVEAVEIPGNRMALAVQWHPEMMYDSDEQAKIFTRFIKEAAK